MPARDDSAGAKLLLLDIALDEAGDGRPATPAAGGGEGRHEALGTDPGKLHDITVTTGGPDSKRNKRLLREGFRFVNVTMNARESKFLGGDRESPYIKLSPSYPVSMVPVPFEMGGDELRHSETVEGMWQGLKLVNGETDLGKFEMTNAWNLKRKTPTGCRVDGYYFGEGMPSLKYAAARRQIYVPAYLSVLENQAKDCVEQLRAEAGQHKIALVDQYKHDICKLDEATHGAFSHACVLRNHLLGVDPLHPPIHPPRPQQRTESDAAGGAQRLRVRARRPADARGAGRGAAKRRKRETTPEKVVGHGC
jgi:hypothetical protein